MLNRSISTDFQADESWSQLLVHHIAIKARLSAD